MPNPIIKIVDFEAGTEIEREMTDDEFAAHQQFQVDAAMAHDKKIAQAQAKSAVLEKLGISEDELRAALS